jgi:multiple sugar transport system ATP-binding protein
VAEVVLENIEKVYDNGYHAVHDLSLTVHDGEFLVLVGPSGCGKTTALRMVAGLEEITDGTLTIGGRVVNDLSPKERDVAMVFQNYALYPHLSVADNIAFGLRLRKAPGDVVKERVAWASQLLGLGDYLDRKPKQLSGGQRQRVAMGRAIVREPQAFLMDEPLSNLDAKLRVQMRAEIAKIQRELGTTTIYVTHDQIEAMTMGDRVAVMRQGVLQQVDAPQRLYDRPANLFVASFIGSPSMNLVEGQITARDGGIAVVIGNDEIALPESLLSRRSGIRSFEGRTVAVGIRPENLHEGPREGATLRGLTILTEALGSELLAHVEIQAPPVMSDEVLEGAIVETEEKATVAELLATEDGHRSTIVGRLEPAAAVRPGKPVELGVDADKLHFFDLETGLAIDGVPAAAAAAGS